MPLTKMILVLTSVTLLGQIGGGGAGQRLLSRLDANKNGTIENSELPERLRPLFRAIDADGNGSISAAELSKSLQRFRSRVPESAKDPGTAGKITDPYQIYGSSGKRQQVESIELFTLHDQDRNKDLQLRINYPTRGTKLPVIVFSHGAYGSKDHYQPLTRFWAAHGYLTIQVNHGDSRSLGTRFGDPSVFRDWRERTRDVSFIIDSLAKIVQQQQALKGRVDFQTIGVGGHSYGASTTNLIGGAEVRGFGRRRSSYKDERVSAILLMSGQGPGSLTDVDSWRSMTLPMMVMSGTKDGPTRTGQPAESRKKPYELSPPGDKYLVWIENLDHGFGNITGSRLYPANAAHVAYTQATTLAFWDAYLKSAATAHKLLRSPEITRKTGNDVELKWK